MALMAYAIGLPAYVGIRVFTPGFFAREDTATPVRIAAVSIVVNVALNLWLINYFGYVGIAIASSISAWLNVVLLVFFLSRRGHYQADRRLVMRIAGILGASSVMAAVLWFGAAWAVPWLSGTIIEKVVSLTALVVGGGIVYLGAARVFGAFSIAEIKASVRGARQSN
jgi:putative peptidoglycan lipid II flippase